jgi:hypothetical protein
MSKRKQPRPRKARSATKIRSKSEPKGRANSKQARVLTLLRRPSGATMASLMQSTGWQQHSVRGFLAGVVRRKLGLKLESEKTDGARVYRIVGGQAPESNTAAQPGA